jgi:phospholipase/carboxylesterase
MKNANWVAPDNGRLGYLYRSTQKSYSVPILMLHGWSGDEKVMWVLETTVPSKSLIVTVRAPLEIEFGGYQWIEGQEALDSSLDDYRPAVDALVLTVKNLQQRLKVDPADWIFMGFSQGAAAAMAYAATASLPQPAGLVVLAGFAPQGSVQSLRGIPLYWGHGTEDELIPIERARLNVERLREAGVDVDFCEAEVGHKVGVECTRGLKTWFEDNFPMAAAAS